jgi:parallel beta-helix repeat protein
VELVTYEGRRFPDAKAVTVQPAGSIRDDERAFLARQNMDAGLKDALGSLNNAYTVILDREFNLPMGSVIASANRIGNGFTVKGCDFGFNRSRGILIKASHGEVNGNRIEGSRMSAILISPEYWWLEAGSSSDVSIIGNTIRNCGGIPICIEATGGNSDIAPAGAHHNITISKNTVEDCFMPGIIVTSTTGLQIADNILNLSKDSKHLPSRMRQAGLMKLQPIVEINCEQTKVER